MSSRNDNETTYAKQSRKKDLQVNVVQNYANERTRNHGSSPRSNNEGDEQLTPPKLISSQQLSPSSNGGKPVRILKEVNGSR